MLAAAVVVAAIALGGAGIAVAQPAFAAGAAVPPQQDPQAAQSRGQAAAATADEPRIDVSLARIRRMLRETPPTPRSGASSLLNLTYHVEVVGRSPRINLLQGFNISRWSAVQYGGMTHDEFLRVVAPPWQKTR